MKTEEIEVMRDLKEIIKYVKTLNAYYIREGFMRGLNLLFFKTKDGWDCNFGIDSHYKYQVSNSNIYTKKEVLEKLNYEFNFIKDKLLKN